MKVTISTKRNKDSSPVNTILDVDYSTISRQQLEAGYNAFLVVKLQNGWRKNGIPAAFQCKAETYAPGTRSVTVPLTPENMTPEQRKVMLQKLMELEGLEVVEEQE